MTSISILGSTGSIGTQALDVISANSDRFSVGALACHSDITALAEQVKRHQPELVCVYDEKKAEKAEDLLDRDVLSGMKGLKRIAQSSEVALNALVGSVGIEPTIAALERGRTVALANKETLVAAGEPVMKLSAKKKAPIIPVDSEHSAIFQCLAGQAPARRLTLTCSGGPFLHTKNLRRVKAKDALKHPTWTMGKKITIDSATLMNKGLEVIEAHHLFDVSYDHIDVVIHPQSIVHSLVEFSDSSVLAQLGWPDMRLPIQYALSHPQRLRSPVKSLDLVEAGRLDFAAPSKSRFPCLPLAYEAGKRGGTMPTVLNAANELAVAAFLKGSIGFLEIPERIASAMAKHKVIDNPDIDDILRVDKKVRGR